MGRFLIFVMENQDYNVETEYYNKQLLSRNLLESVDQLKNKICGINKLRSKVNQEISFLEKRKNSNTLKKEHIICSNLLHYEALVSKLLEIENPLSVLEVFHYNSHNEHKKIIIDIVSNERTIWCKVIARNPKALSQISKGEGEYQQKSILDHGLEFLECAEQNMVLFSPPQVQFYFASGVERNLAEELIKLGVYIDGKIIEDVNASNEQCSNVVLPQINSRTGSLNINRVNLDVSAMIAYVSALTNGHAHKKIRGIVLSQQAVWERLSPVKRVLDKFFQGMELYACDTAMENFQSIVHILGGEGEKKRAAEFCSRITVVKDVPFSLLKPGGQIKPRSLVIFGTGQALKAITVTSNSAFIRAAKTQGVHFDIFIHEARALTERKEINEI